MKLTNSIPMAKYYMTQAPLSSEGRTDLARYMIEHYQTAKLKAVRPCLAYAWALWFYLTKAQRQHIILQSVSEADLVGGYFQSVNDSHIDALLRRVITPVEIARQIAWAQDVLSDNDTGDF